MATQQARPEERAEPRLEFGTMPAARSGPQGTGQGAARVMAFVGDDTTRRVFVNVAAECGWRRPLIAGGDIRTAIEQLGGQESPDLLFVDLGDTADPMPDINALADVCEPGTRVVALGTVNDMRLYRALTGAGIADYLLKPVQAADLRTAAAGAAASRASDPGRAGRLFVVTGTRGGIGASMVAAGLAWTAAASGKRTALLDLDLRFGTGALAFDVDPGTGVTDILADPGRIDPLFLERASLPVADNLSLFAAEAPLGVTLTIAGDAGAILAGELLKEFAVVVADLPRGALAAQPNILEVTEKLLLVGDLSLAAMRDALRIRTMAGEAAPGCAPQLVLNAPRPSAKGDLPRAEFEKTVGLTAAAVLPYDRKAAGEADSQGRPVAAIRGKLATALGRLARDCIAPPVEAEPARAPKLFGLGRR